MTRFVLSPRARRDITDIWLYTADRWSVDQADAYVHHIETAVLRAIDLPAVGAPVLGLPSQYRKVRAGSHRIIYRRTGEELIVVRILHERQDVPNAIED